jgi:hypothetical protein
VTGHRSATGRRVAVVARAVQSGRGQWEGHTSELLGQRPESATCRGIVGSGDGAHLDRHAAQLMEAGRSTELTAPNRGRGRCEELRQAPRSAFWAIRALLSFITKTDMPVGPVE